MAIVTIVIAVAAAILMLPVVSDSLCFVRSFRRRRTSGLSTVNKDQIAERGARMARRDDREYREYLREE